MLDSAENLATSQKPQQSSNPNAYAPLNAAGSTLEQATLGRSLAIKGEITGAESLYVDGHVEGSISFPEHRVTVGRNGSVAANINAREVVIMGCVKGNVQCADRLDLRSEGSLMGDVIAQRISVEDGAILKGSVQVRAEQKQKAAGQEHSKNASSDSAKPAVTDHAKVAAANA